MTDKLIISTKNDNLLNLSTLESDFNFKSAHSLEGGALIDHFKESDITKLRKQGFRVKRLRNVNILNIGQFSIDVSETLPIVKSELDIEDNRKSQWRHYLLQFIAHPQQDWLDNIKSKGVQYVEPLPPYGAFVVIDDSETIENLEKLPFIAWIGVFKPAYRIAKSLENLSGTLKYLGIDVIADGDIDAVIKTINDNSGEVISLESAEGNEKYHHLMVEIDAKHVSALANLRDIRWLEHQPPAEVEDERSCQIVAEELNGVAAPNTGPELGYQDLLDDCGISGDGVIVGICDSGIDTHNNTTMHPDLAGRMAFFADQTGGTTTTDLNGHGSHVAGIALGNASTGETDPQGFKLGQGMAPGARFGSVNSIGTGATTSWPQWVRSMVNNNANVMNNSWGSGSGGSGYTSRARTFDQLVRDPDSSSAELEKLSIMFSAGNEGGGASTVTDPKEAKNIIVVGNSLNFRPNELFPTDDIRGINGSSSRGPAVDGRILPTVVAPGTNIVAVRSTVDTSPAPGTQQPRTAYTDTGGTSHSQYTAMTGTSMAAPHVSGLCALLIEWWRNRTGGQTPSQAMLKALLINGAEDLAGGENWRVFRPVGSGIRTRSPVGFTPNTIVEQSPGNIFNTLNQVASVANVLNPGDWFYDSATDTLTYRLQSTTAFRLHLRDATPLANVPNNDQGWGRVSLQNIVKQSPDSDRGSKIFLDQRHAFTATGQEYLLRISPADITRPMRITIAWTDAAAGMGASPALVNDLDLEVTEVATGTVYRGNVFRNGFSFSDPSDSVDDFDDLNNVECVYLLNPNGVYEVRILAANIMSSARPDVATPWQDFSMVIDNAEVPSSEPVNVVPVIDRSGSMESYDYVDITVTSSKQFVDLLSVDDRIAIVSFGNDGLVEYPTIPSPTLQQITGDVTRNAAKTEIDRIAFGGCTYMGDGIIKARDLLASETGSRAMLLFSDGYDNKGCNQSDPSRLSASAAAATLPADMPIYSCAMGPTSDQDLLEQLATDTDGRYYFMPSIDDLFEIYNYIRGQVTGEGIIVNESALASKSRVGGFVEGNVEKVTFSVSWPDNSLRYVPHDPRQPNHINIRLRDPKGKLLPNNASFVRRTVGKGYAAFTIEEPVAGRWYVEVETARNKHTRYTVGGFVKSNIIVNLPTIIQQIPLGMTLKTAVQVFDGNTPITGVIAKSKAISPKFSIEDITKKYTDQLDKIKIDPLLFKDIDPKIAKLNILRNQILISDKKDIFSQSVKNINFSDLRIRDLKRHGLDIGMQGFFGNNGGGSMEGTAHFQPYLDAVSNRFVAPFESRHLSAIGINLGDTKRNSGIQLSQFKPMVKGSHNLIISTSGVSPISGTKFERKELVSVLVK